MRLLFIDGSAGASGDMLLGALVDLGLPVAPLRRALRSLPIEGWTLRSRRIERCALGGRKVDVRLRPGSAQPARGWKEIRRIVSAGELPDAVRDTSLAVFRRLLEAEAAVHNRSFDRVHLHEAGGVDAIVDVVGCCWGVHRLQVDRVLCSQLTTGFGSIRCAHGEYPVPAPATLNLCRGVPVSAGPIASERLTPTGAAILVTLADDWCEMPPMIPERVGYGAGDRDLAPNPNMLRAVLGSGPNSQLPTHAEVHVVECQIDDATAEELSHAAERLAHLGALDVLRTAVTMKKGRLGTLIRAVCRPEDSARVAHALLAETPTLGVRVRSEARWELDRVVRKVETPFGTVRIKLASGLECPEKASAEYEDCKKLALRHDVPIRRIQLAALAALDASGRERSKRRK